MSTLESLWQRYRADRARGGADPAAAADLRDAFMAGAASGLTLSAQGRGAAAWAEFTAYCATVYGPAAVEAAAAKGARAAAGRRPPVIRPRVGRGEQSLN